MGVPAVQNQEYSDDKSESNSYDDDYSKIFSDDYKSKISAASEKSNLFVEQSRPQR